MPEMPEVEPTNVDFVSFQDTDWRSKANTVTRIQFPDYEALREKALPWGSDIGRTFPPTQTRGQPKKIQDSVLDLVGGTPMIRMSRLAAALGLKCELLGKCEFFNPGGSVKDRIALRMIEDAEKRGDLEKGGCVIEATSGNTGIGMSMVCAVKGINMMVTMPEKMSAEKSNTMKRLGAMIFRTPTEAAWNDDSSHIALAIKLQKSIHRSKVLDQYANPSNVLAHYDTTGMEILEQCDYNLDMIVVGAGTGGTITGIAKRMKEYVPNCQVIAADPIGSSLALPDSLNVEGPSYQVEGIGYDFIPSVLDRRLIDKWVKTDDATSFALARQCILLEGLLIGGSCGSALQAVVEEASKLKEGQRCVVVLPDGSRNYMSKFMDDGWMERVLGQKK